jgi:hypothetical protein
MWIGANSPYCTKHKGRIVLINLKSRGHIDFWNTELCQIQDCYGSSEKLYSDKEHTGIDVCNEHYIRLMHEVNNG